MRSGLFTFLKTILSSSIRFKASPRLLGRYSPGEGAGQEIKLGAGLTLAGDTLSAGGTVAESSQGGNGAEDEGKLAEFGSGGTLTGSIYLIARDETEPDVKWGRLSSSMVEFSDLGGSKVGLLSSPVLSAYGATHWLLPDRGGTVAILRVFSNRVTANASTSLEPREIWWDMSEKKAWAKCPGWLGIAAENPPSALDGDIYANSIAGKIRMYVGGFWWDLGDWST